jgi:hypothetical protein
MSVIANHKCDACGKIESADDSFGGMPDKWYSVNVYREGDKHQDAFNKEACCSECLNSLLDKAKQ